MQSFPYILTWYAFRYIKISVLSCFNNIRPFFDSDANHEEVDPIFTTEISVDDILDHCIDLNDICWTRIGIIFGCILMILYSHDNGWEFIHFIWCIEIIEFKLDLAKCILFFGYIEMIWTSHELWIVLKVIILFLNS